MKNDSLIFDISIDFKTVTKITVCATSLKFMFKFIRFIFSEAFPIFKKVLYLILLDVLSAEAQKVVDVAMKYEIEDASFVHKDFSVDAITQKTSYEEKSTEYA